MRKTTIYVTDESQKDITKLREANPSFTLSGFTREQLARMVRKMERRLKGGQL
jgi:hypothetical protein